MNVALRTAVITVPLILAHLLPAQCTPQWQPGDPLPYVRGAVNAALTWDPDGGGPAPLRLVVGGNFAAGALASTFVATFDGSQWAPLGSLPGEVTALVNWNGALVAAVTTIANDSIVQWDGATWQFLGSTSGYVHTLGAFNGELIVGGQLSDITGSSTGLSVNNIARWNGSSWSALGTGVGGPVNAVAEFNSLLVVGGSFTYAGGAAAGNLGAWNGSVWLPTATCNGPVSCLAVRSAITINSGQLYVGGQFTTCGGASTPFVARYLNSTGLWGGVGSGLPGPCLSLFVNNGLSFGIEVTAALSNPGSPQKVSQWNGTAWNNLGSVVDTLGDVQPSCLTYYGGQYVLGFEYADQALRRYAAANWPPLRGPGVDDRVNAVNAAGNDLVIGGAFLAISGITMNGIARGTYGNWQPLGSGVAPGGVVMAIARTVGGDIIAGGSFASAGGIAVSNLARWNGSTWNALGAGLNGTVNSLCRLANGDIIAAGAFTMSGAVATNHIARWNGSTWSALGNGLSAQVHAVVQLGNGDLVVGGDFAIAGTVVASRVARWNGVVWAALGYGMDNTVYALAALPNGDLVAGGHFQNADGTYSPNIARWNGAAWSPLTTALFRPNNDVHALTTLPDGDLIAGGATFYHSPPVPGIRTNVERWNGSVWSSLDVRGNVVAATALAADGHVIAVGDFALAGNITSGNVAHLVTTCPAHAVAFGFGCPGSGGPNVLSAQTLPWTGSVFRVSATGMPAFGFAVTVTGFLPTALPIVSLLPQGGAGCTLLVSPAALDVVLPAAGVAQSQLVIPDSVSLANAVIYQQVVPFAMDALGNLTAITATNGLVVTIGTL